MRLEFRVTQAAIFLAEGSTVGKAERIGKRRIILRAGSTNVSEQTLRKLFSSSTQESF